MQHEDVFIRALSLPPGSGRGHLTSSLSAAPPPVLQTPSQGNPALRQADMATPGTAPGPPPLCVPQPCTLAHLNQLQSLGFDGLGFLWPRSWVAVDK